MSDPTPRHWSDTWWALFFLAVATLILYGHTLHVPWYMDDTSFIIENPLIRNLSAAWRGAWQPRGFVTLTFALNYKYGGLDPAGYHLVNILIHFTCGSVALLLLRRIFKDNPVLALWGALIFIVHPLQTQAVTYTVQRMASLSALFFLLAIYLFIRSREILANGPDFWSYAHLGWYSGALFCGALAVLSKENAAVLPLALLLFARFFIAPPQQWRSLLCAVAPFALLPLLVGIYKFFPLVSGSAELNQVSVYANLASLQGNGPLPYLFTEFSVLWVYLRLLFLPYGQALDHDYPIVRDLLTVSNGVALLGLLLLVWFAWQQRQRRPVLSFGIFWFFLTLAVESSIIPLDPLFEHRLYLPIFGFSVIVAEALRRSPWPKAAMVGAGGVIIVLGVLTWQRNELWNDPISFYQANLRIAPRSERVHNGLGYSYYAVGRSRDAEEIFLKTLEINPRYYYNFGNLPMLYQQQGLINEAIALLEKGLTYFPGDAAMYNNLACIYDNYAATAQSAYHNAQAERYFEAAMKSDPKFFKAFGNLGRHYKRLGRFSEAEALLRRSLALNPLDAQFQGDLADIYIRSGRFTEAATLKQ